jgi:CheY-like chemotaxis protein
VKNRLAVLVIEDDQIERMKLKRATSLLEMNHNIIEAKNGEEALDLLEDKSNLPDIILLDLNMPRMNGIEFLRTLKEDEVLKYIPSIVLTTSTNPKDVLESYKIGIAGYIIKPLKYEDYVSLVEKTLEYWSINELTKK